MPLYACRFYYICLFYFIFTAKIYKIVRARKVRLVHVCLKQKGIVYAIKKEMLLIALLFRHKYNYYIRRYFIS